MGVRMILSPESPVIKTEVGSNAATLAITAIQSTPSFALGDVTANTTVAAAAAGYINTYIYIFHQAKANAH